MSERDDDRKMFAPVFRGQPRSPEAQLCDLLGGYAAGATPRRLADDLLRLRLAIGLTPSVTKRVEELLDGLERATLVQRIPDGRYRMVKTKG
jgi:hypothetical protein